MAQVRNRDYEVSIWTLQDEFISVLKPTGVVNKGQIEKPNMKIVDDGTQEFTFSIPMYIISNGQRVENPIWKNTRDGNIIADMRKIKVTFNRGRSKEKTFEFLITDVTERHENDQLYCDVNCEGMAFHELGKRGYSVKLLTEDFYLENERYFSRETGPSGKLLVGYEPKPTLSYWLNKFLPEKPIVGADPRLWYYKIEMDWSGYAKSAQRKTNEVYEEEYVSSWKLQQDSEGNEVYAPNQVEALKVKERLVDLKESNIYNLTQDLAETFGVFCRYEYEHDDNLEITGRTVVFYNNYMREREGYIDITYPFETAAITRTRDSKDLTTKMFVTSVDDENAAGGVLTIMDVDANKSREQYLLNFEYLYSIGSITAEQYQEIPKYEAAIGKINIELGNIAAPLLSLQNQVTDLEAEITIRQNSIDAAKEAAGRALDSKLAITDGDGTFEYDPTNPDKKSPGLTKDDVYYITFSKKGVKPETLRLYTEFDSTSGVKAESELKNFLIEYEGNTGYVSRVTNLDIHTTTTIYACYAYDELQYYDTIMQTYKTKQGINETALKQAQAKLDNTNDRIKKYQIQQEKLLADKQKLIKKFDDMMGAAIRESYWQPDNYDDYGDNYTDNLAFNSNTTVTPKGGSGLTQLVWDTNLFQDEQKAYYEESVNLDKYYYPVIPIDSKEKFDFVKKNYDKLSVMFYDVDAVKATSSSIDIEKNEKDSNLRQYVLGSTAHFCFIKKNNTIYPAIVVTGAAELVGGRSFEGTDKKWVNSLRRFMGRRVVKITENNGADSNTPLFQTTVGVVTTETVDGIIQYSIEKGWSVDSAHPEYFWANYKWNPNINTEIVPNRYDNERYTSLIELYYPRIKIGSLSLKTSEDQLAISYYGETLKNNDDYYILTRDDSEWNSKNELEVADSAYYITLKPETMIRLGTYTGNVGIRFCISNANVSIYLDALQVMKENSQPKVSYTVDVSFVDFDFIYDLYNKLNRICNINDHELHFENVQGYISEINLDCDVPANDSIEVKNYKTKFEDLFSTIVAQTQSMKKSEYAIGLATSAFTVNGDLADKVMESSWRRMDLNLAFNKGKLTINEADGIWGMSEDGVVAFRGGGIFTATKKDDLGNWIWNTGILPQGINADLITTGRLDTNKINIYSGDNVRFQFNGDGIFAYRDYALVDPRYASSDASLIPSGGTSQDTHQFVTMNQEGIFLVAEGGAQYKDGDTIKKLDEGSHINRVSMSWDGFTIRDWGDNPVFYANTDGSLTVKGHIQASSLTIGNQGIDSYINGKKGIHSGTLNPPLDSDTDTLNASVGDLYYNTNTQAYWRCVKTSGTGRWKGFQLGETYLDINPSDGTINMNAGSIMTLKGASKLILQSGDIEKIKMIPGEGIILSSDAKIDLQGTGGIKLNGGNIDMTGGQISLTAGDMTDNVDNTTQYLQKADALIFKLSGQEVFSISQSDPIFKIQPDTSVNDLQVEGELTTVNINASSIETNELIINGIKFLPNSSNTYLSNIKIIFTKNDGTTDNVGQFPSTEHGVLWIYPSTQSGSPATQPTEEKVTWTSGKISSRVSINSGTVESNAIKFKGSSISTGDTYDYTAKIKIYGTGSGTRRINTASTLEIGGVTLTLSSDVSLTPGAEKTLVFKKESSLTNITSSGSIQGKITLHTTVEQGQGAYVNLQRDVTNNLIIKNNINSNGISSIASINEVKDCVVKYIP